MLGRNYTLSNTVYIVINNNRRYIDESKKLDLPLGTVLFNKDSAFDLYNNYLQSKYSSMPSYDYDVVGSMQESFREPEVITETSDGWTIQILDAPGRGRICTQLTESNCIFSKGDTQFVAQVYSVALADLMCNTVLNKGKARAKVRIVKYRGRLSVTSPSMDNAKEIDKQVNREKEIEANSVFKASKFKEGQVFESKSTQMFTVFSYYRLFSNIGGKTVHFGDNTRYAYCITSAKGIGFILNSIGVKHNFAGINIRPELSELLSNVSVIRSPIYEIDNLSRLPVSMLNTTPGAGYTYNHVPVNNNSGSTKPTLAEMAKSTMIAIKRALSNPNVFISDQCTLRVDTDIKKHMSHDACKLTKEETERLHLEVSSMSNEFLTGIYQYFEAVVQNGGELEITPEILKIFVKGTPYKKDKHGRVIIRESEYKLLKLFTENGFDKVSLDSFVKQA